MPQMAPEALWERARDFLSLFLTPLGTPRARQRLIARAMEFPLDFVVERFRQEQGLTEPDAQALAWELKRYLAICAICSNQLVPMEGRSTICGACSLPIETATTISARWSRAH
jgi:hypothetical protein